MNQKGSLFIPNIGAIFVFFALITLGFGIVAFLNKPVATEIPSLQREATPDLKQIRGKVKAGMDLKAAFEVSPEKIAKGKELYERNNYCASCHGAAGNLLDASGQLMAIAQTPTPPRNFTQATGWKNGRQISKIYETLTDGLSNGLMPSAQAMLNPEERILVAHYVRSLAPGAPAPTSSDEKYVNDKYGLAKGIKEPHQIPVAAAFKLVMAEAGEQAMTVEKAIEEVRNRAVKGDEGSALLESGSSSLEGSLSILSRNGNWTASAKDLQQLAVGNVGAHGFHPSVNNWTLEDWTLVHKSSNSIFSGISLPKPEPKPVKASAASMDGKTLFTKNMCTACHHPEKKVIGPSFQMLRDKYKADESTLTKLTAKVKAGGAGVWGAIPMAPHPHLAEVEIKATVKYMLTGK